MKSVVLTSVNMGRRDTAFELEVGGLRLEAFGKAQRFYYAKNPLRLPLRIVAATFRLRSYRKLKLAPTLYGLEPEVT